MGQLVEPVKALISNPFMDAIKLVIRLTSVTTALDFARKLTVSMANLIQGRLKPFGRLDFFSVRQGEKGFQTEVSPDDDVTRSVGNSFYTVNAEVHKQFTQRGALNRDGLDRAKNFARLAKLIDELANPQLVATYQLPTGLLESERTILLNLLKRGAAKALANLSRLVLEEKLITPVYALTNILYSLRSEQSEVGITPAFRELGNVLLQGADVDILAGQFEITALQSYAVIPNQTGNVYLLVKRFILFVSVQFEFQRFHDSLAFLTRRLPNGLSTQSIFLRSTHGQAVASSKLTARSLAVYSVRPWEILYSKLYNISVSYYTIWLGIISQRA